MKDKCFVDTNIWVYASLSNDKDIQKRNIAIKLIQNIETLKKAWLLKKKYTFSLWDSLIIASALQNNCSILYTEDLQHKQIIDGKLTIINPFVLVP